MKFLGWILEYEDGLHKKLVFALAVPELLVVKGLLKLVELCKRWRRIRRTYWRSCGASAPGLKSVRRNSKPRATGSRSR